MISAANFELLVERAMGELFRTEGMVRTDGEVFSVRVENGRAGVVVRYDQSRGRELTVWLVESDFGGEPPLELPDALRATACSAASIERIARGESSDPAYIEQLLAFSAELLAQFGRPFLAGDRGTYEKARAIRSERARMCTAELQLRPILEKAAEAWAAKDYSRLVALLSPVRDSIDEPRLRQLRFAEERLDH